MAIETVAGIVRTHGAARPDAVALRFDDEVITFADLDDRSNRVANALRTAGVGPGDRVAFLDKNGPELFDVLFGAAKLNAVSVAVNWRLAPAEIAYIVDDAGAKVLFVGPDFLPHVETIEPQLRSVTSIVALAGGHPRYHDYEAWRDAHTGEADPGVPTDHDDIGLQLYTSGTTGLPKGAMLSNGNLFGLVHAAGERWEMGPGSVNMAAMPYFHIGGSGWALVGMALGAETVIVREVDPAAILRLISRHRVTHAFLVPAVLQFMLMTPGVEDADFSSFQLLVYGASPITDTVLTKAMATFGCRFVQVYGLTETTGAIVQLDAEHHRPDSRPELLRSCGKPYAGVELRIVDPSDDTDMAVGEVGELWVRTAQNMVGYWGKPEETARTITDDGWLRTGDAGYVDADGFVYLHDRMKDMIVSGGENIYPADVENTLMHHPAVVDVAVIGVPHDRWGETVKAMVVLDPTGAATATEDEIIAFARAHLGHYKCPTSVDFLLTLPRNPSGKLLKRELRQPYWEGLERNIN